MTIGGYGAGRLSGPFYYLESLGLTDVILPFILIFAVSYAVIKKSNIFKDNPKVDTIVALVLSLSVVIPHVLGRYPPNADVVNIINTALPNIGAVLIALVMFFVLVGIWGASPSWGGSLHSIVVILSILVVGYVFGRAAGWFTSVPSWLYWLTAPDTLALIVIILVFGLIVSYVTGSDNKGTPGEGMLKAFSDLFEKK